MEKLSFDVFLPFYAFEPEPSFGTIRDVVLECESLGYDSVHLDDHLMWGKKPILECWTVLSALSGVTERIRLGTTVLSALFRNPSVLAKMAATLDVVSNGRLELGIGAGVQEAEHAFYGLGFPKASDRIERLKESVIILKKLWTQEKAAYIGKYYWLKNAVCEPKPVQKPHPPITIGGSGEQLMLKLQARYADRIDWGYLPSVEDYEHKLRVLEKHCKAVGRDFDEIQKSAWLGGQIFLAENQNELDKRVLQWKPKSVTAKTFRKTNLVCVQSECMKKVQEYVDLGVEHFVLFFGDLPSTNGLRVFAENVMNRV